RQTATTASLAQLTAAMMESAFPAPTTVCAKMASSVMVQRFVKLVLAACQAVHSAWATSVTKLARVASNFEGRRLRRFNRWWQWTSRKAQRQASGTGSFPIGFTWTQECSGVITHLLLASAKRRKSRFGRGKRWQTISANVQ